jgi:hypothetical protein
MWSMAALAAEAAEEAPRASMMAAPRLPTFGMYSLLVPGFVVDGLRRGLAGDGAEADVRIHRGRVVAPDDHFLDVGDRLAGARGELRHGAVVVEAQHGGEILGFGRLGPTSWRCRRWCWPGCRPPAP